MQISSQGFSRSCLLAQDTSVNLGFLRPHKSVFVALEMHPDLESHPHENANDVADGACCLLECCALADVSECPDLLCAGCWRVAKNLILMNFWNRTQDPIQTCSECASTCFSQAFPPLQDSEEPPPLPHLEVFQ